jgi:hypothetical protein
MMIQTISAFGRPSVDCAPRTFIAGEAESRGAYPPPYANKKPWGPAVTLMEEPQNRDAKVALLPFELRSWKLTR